MSKKINGKKPISILDCSDNYKHDINTVLYIYELEEKTLDNKIKWEREWNNKRLSYNYYGTYTNKNGIKVKLEVLDDYQEGIELTCSYSNHGKLIKTLFLTEWVYSDELSDLMSAINNYWNYTHGDKNKYTDPYYNRRSSRALLPYYNDNYKNKSTPKKVKNERGKKADRLLENVAFEYNCQILGKKGCLEL